jgi:putative phosphoesterase
MVLSDSHGDLSLAHQVLQDESFDMILHLGDSIKDMYELKDCYDTPIEGVIGNIDYVTEGDEMKIITLNNYKIMLCHGHRFKVNSGPEYLVSFGESKGVDIILFGHTHTPVILEQSTYVMNPGSISNPRNVPHPSYGVLLLNENNIEGEIIYIK